MVILKPDAVQRGLIGELIKRIENTGLKLVAMKMIIATEEQLWKHYAKDDAWFLSKGKELLQKERRLVCQLKRKRLNMVKILFVL